MTDRASAEELREAARAMWYVHTEDQRFAGPVSADPYGDFERALLAALRDTGPRPDSGIGRISTDRLKHAMSDHEDQQGPEHSCDFGCAEDIAVEYRHPDSARLSTPRTETPDD